MAGNAAAFLGKRRSSRQGGVYLIVSIRIPSTTTANRSDEDIRSGPCRSGPRLVHAFVRHAHLSLNGITESLWLSSHADCCRCLVVNTWVPRTTTATERTVLVSDRNPAGVDLVSYIEGYIHLPLIGITESLCQSHSSRQKRCPAPVYEILQDTDAALIQLLSHCGHRCEETGMLRRMRCRET